MPPCDRVEKPIKTLWIVILIVLFALIIKFTQPASGYFSIPGYVGEPDIVYVEALNSPPLPRIVLDRSSARNHTCSCVEFAKALLGISGHLGNAWELKPDHQTPLVGDLILFKNHVGVVISYTSETVTFVEANFTPCKSDTREIDRSSSIIVGYKAANTQ